MTVLKAMAIRTASMAGLQRYLERDGKCVRVGTLNIANERRWALEMDQHARLERVAERTAKRGLHFILAFNLDDISPLSRDGSLDEEAVDFVDGYVREFVETEFPGLQVAWAVHVERCERDGTSRLAAHIVVGRAIVSDFEYPDGSGRVARTGALYDRRKSVQREQVERVRRMDRESGFREVSRGRNSASHFVRDPSRAERHMRSRGGTPRKDELARLVREAAERTEVTDMASLKAALEAEGHDLDISRTVTNATLTDAESGRRYRLSTLGIDRSALEREFAARAATERATRAASLASEGALRPREAPTRITEPLLRTTEPRIRAVSRAQAATAIASRLAYAAVALFARVLAALRAAFEVPVEGVGKVHFERLRGDRCRER